MKKKTLAMFLILAMVFTTFASTSVFAWTDGEILPEGNSKVDGEEEATVDVTGKIGKFSNTDDDDDDEGGPEDGDKAWINVTIPTSLMFASTTADKFKVIAPKHQIVNNSARSVKVSAKSFTVDNAAEDAKVNNMLHLVLKAESIQRTESVMSTPLILRDKLSNVTFNGDETLFILKNGKAPNKGEPIDTDQGKATIQIGGELDSSYGYTDTVVPTYKLVLNFKSGQKYA